MKEKIKKVEFKDYPRTYELVFSDRDHLEKGCKLDGIEFYRDIPASEPEYCKLWRDISNTYDRAFFDFLVKMRWLQKRFIYHGMRRVKNHRNGFHLDHVFSLYLKSYVGIDLRRTVYASGAAGKIAGYFDDFFPNFDEGNPFTEEYNYPFKYLNLSCLIFVYQLDERMELLKRGEEKQMSYVEFLDYALNYVLNYNEEHGERYAVILANSCSPYIKDKKKSKITYEEWSKTCSVYPRKT